MGTAASLDEGCKAPGTRYAGFRERYFDAGPRHNGIVYKYSVKQGSEEAIPIAISDICVSMKASDYLELPDALCTRKLAELDPKAESL